MYVRNIINKIACCF